MRSHLYYHTGEYARLDKVAPRLKQGEFLRQPGTYFALLPPELLRVTEGLHFAEKEFHNKAIGWLRRELVSVPLTPEEESIRRIAIDLHRARASTEEWVEMIDAALCSLQSSSLCRTAPNHAGHTFK